MTRNPEATCGKGCPWTRPYAQGSGMEVFVQCDGMPERRDMPKRTPACRLHTDFFLPEPEPVGHDPSSAGELCRSVFDAYCETEGIAPMGRFTTQDIKNAYFAAWDASPGRYATIGCSSTVLSEKEEARCVNCKTLSRTVQHTTGGPLCATCRGVSQA